MTATAEPSAGPKAKVFISYSRKDLDFVDRLEASLKERGFEPLVDRTEITAFEDWWKRIETLIGLADTIIFVISPDGVASEVALREVNYAASLNKRFAPIVCRRTDETAIAEPLRKLNFVFFDDPAEFDARSDQLAEALRTDIAWIRQHTEIGVSARRWAAAGRPGPRGLLLRSPTLEEAESWIASRPSGAPEPTEETRSFILLSRRAATQRRNILSASLGSGLLVALILAGLAYWQRGIAVQQREIAVEQREYAGQQREGALSTQSRLLAVQAGRAAGETDIQTSILLSLEALRGADDLGPSHPSPEAEKTLLDALYRNPLRGILRADGGKYKSAAFVSGTSKLITITESGSPAFWATDNGRVTGKLDMPVPPGKLSDVFSDAARPILVFRSQDGSYFAWNAATGQPVSGVSGTCSDKQATFAFDDSGARLFVHCGSVSVYNFDSGQKVEVPGKFEHFAQALRAGTFVVSADKTISVIDKNTGAVAATWQQPDSVYSLAMNYDGDVVFTANYDGVSFHDSASGTETRPLLKTDQARTFDILASPAANLLVSDGDSGSQLWNIDRSSPVQGGIPAGHAVQFLSNGYLISSNGAKMVLSEYPTEGHTGTRFAVDKGDLYVAAGHTFLAATSDSKTVASLADSGDIYLWSTQPAMLLRAMEDKRGRRLGTPAVISSNGKVIVTTTEAGLITAWDAETFQELGHVKPADPAASLAVSADGRRLVYIDSNANYDVLDVATFRTIKPVGLPDSIYAAAFSPDGETLAVGGDNSLSLWKLADGSKVASCATEDNVGNIVWAHDAIAYTMDKGTVALLARESCRSTQIAAFKIEPPDKPPANADIRVKDGLVLANLANRVQIWSIPEARSLLDATREQWPVFDESFAQTTLFELLPGRRVIVGRQPDGLLKIYDVMTREQVLSFDADTNDCCMPVAISVPSGGDRLMTLWSERGAYRLRMWQMFPTPGAATTFAETIVPECLSPGDRAKLGLDATPPRWCITMNKRPYDTAAWRQWLASKDAGRAAAMPRQ